MPWYKINVKICGIQNIISMLHFSKNVFMYRSERLWLFLPSKAAKENNSFFIDYIMQLYNLSSNKKYYFTLLQFACYLQIIFNEELCRGKSN